MVAKDFTLQQSVPPLTRVWVECHKRMARWFILMDHKMQAAGAFSLLFFVFFYPSAWLFCTNCLLRCVVFASNFL